MTAMQLWTNTKHLWGTTDEFARKQLFLRRVLFLPLRKTKQIFEFQSDTLFLITKTATGTLALKQRIDACVIYISNATMY